MNEKYAKKMMDALQESRINIENIFEQIVSNHGVTDDQIDELCKEMNVLQDFKYFCQGVEIFYREYFEPVYENLEKKMEVLRKGIKDSE